MLAKKEKQKMDEQLTLPGEKVERGDALFRLWNFRPRIFACGILVQYHFRPQISVQEFSPNGIFVQ